ncbi:MAG: Fe-S-cluster-containing hydrogenase [Myxococcota bacterium]|nr:Fe-S-cluster-containing hydrogenase [Myxococcota bacterium]
MNDDMKYWRSLEDRAEGSVTDPHRFREFEPGAETLELNDVDRRSFFGIMGASAALAGSTLTSGCVRKGVQHILPYTKRPEHMIPGEPLYYRTSWAMGDTVLGLHVKSQDGRPIKVAGNPEHPLSKGASNEFAQASVLDVYDPDRIQKPTKDGVEISLDEAWKAFDAQIATLRSGDGAGLAILLDGEPSPTRRRLLKSVADKLPKAQIFRHDWANNAAARAGLDSVGMAGHTFYSDATAANVVVALDTDCFSDGDGVLFSRGFANGRKLKKASDKMNRLYAVEGKFSTAGANADHRLRVPSSHVGEFLRTVAGLISPDSDPSLQSEITNRAASKDGGIAHDARFTKFAKAVADDLLANKGASLVMVGERQPAWVHALAHYVNHALGNVGKTVFYAKNQEAEAGTLAELVDAIGSDSVNTLVVLGPNPVYDAPSDLKFAEAFKKIPTTFAFSSLHSETTKSASWAMPKAHYLEAWGDIIANDGTVSIQQPLVAPLFWGVSTIEVLTRILGTQTPNGHDEVRITQTTGKVTAESAWRRMIHSGIVSLGTSVTPAFTWTGLASALKTTSNALLPGKPSLDSMELILAHDAAVFDGRFGNNGWLQEAPDPITKVTWDNTLQLSPKTAKELGVKSEDLVAVTVGDATVNLPVFVTPGTADYVAVTSVGYGRKLGVVAEGAGFDVNPLRKSTSPHVVTGARLKATGETYELACTQDHHTMVEPITGRKRPVVRETTLADYRKDPDWVESYEMLPKEKIKSLWKQPNRTDGHQWGMVIDLNACTGCNACVVACQAENNIPIVGKERVLQGREMHWIRIDRYFTGTEDEPQAVMQPVACSHCETAPCENVCPVAATVHSVDGLNDMAYNRCIGTRYCANNCPFKVRRFNFFNFQKENQEMAPMLGMQKNPDVTIRFRGVMEKCTYCTQRIQAAKIKAKRERPDGRVLDGEIVTACEDVCPSGAITFGDINDPESRVSKLKKSDRNYELLRELNLHSRTTFLARVRNPNPALV